MYVLNLDTLDLTDQPLAGPACSEIACRMFKFKFKFSTEVFISNSNWDYKIGTRTSNYTIYAWNYKK